MDEFAIELTSEILRFAQDDKAFFRWDEIEKGEALASPFLSRWHEFG